MANTKITTNVIADDAVTSAKLDTNIAIAGTLGVTGVVTANAGIQIDALNLDGRTIASTDANGNINISPHGTGTTVIASNTTVGGTLGVTGLITGTTATASGSTNTTALASTAFVQQELTTLIGGAPSTLNDLNELAAAINDDANYNSTLTTALATKLPLAGGTMTGNLRVDWSDQYLVGIKIRNNHSSAQSDWNVGASGGTSGWGAANGNFIIRDDTTNSTGIEIEKGAGGATGALYIVNDGNVGIGTASASSYNNYASNLVVYEAGHGGITIATNGNNHTSLYFADGTSGDAAYRGYLDYDHADDSLDIGTAGTQSVTITSAGALGVGAGTVSLPSLSFANDTNTGIYSPSADNLGFAIGGQSRAFMSANQFNVAAKIVATELDCNGNADISGTLAVSNKITGVAATNRAALELTGGTASQSYTKIHMLGAGTAVDAIRIQNDGGHSIFGTDKSNGAGLASSTTNYSTVMGSIGATAAHIVTNNSVKMTVLSGGNVGVGTTNPSAKVHVYTAGAEGINIGLQNSERYYNIETDGGNLMFKDVSAGGLARMTVKSDGNVGVGITNPSKKLHVSMGGTDVTGQTYDAMILQNSDAVQLRIVDAGDGGGNGGHAGLGNDNGNLNIAAAGVMTFSTALTANEALYGGGSGTGGDERMRINDGGGVFCAEIGSNGDYSMYIGSVNAAGTGNRYVHVQVYMTGSMYWIEAIGYDYTANLIDGLAGGYLYNVAATNDPTSRVLQGDIVAQYQTAAGIELVIDTGATGTSNRWGSIVLRGGTDTISPNCPIEIIQYSYTSTTTRIY